MKYFGIGEIIKQARKMAGITQKDLASAVGCAEVTIRQYEANRREPSYDMYRKLENALKISLVANADSFSSITQIVSETNNEECFDFVINNPLLISELKKMGIKVLLFENNGLHVDYEDETIPITLDSLKNIRDSLSKSLTKTVRELWGFQIGTTEQPEQPKSPPDNKDHTK